MRAARDRPSNWECCRTVARPRGAKSLLRSSAGSTTGRIARGRPSAVPARSSEGSWSHSAANELGLIVRDPATERPRRTGLEPARCHHEYRSVAGESVRSSLVRGEENQLNRWGEPAQPEIPSNITMTSPSAGGLAMALPPAAKSSVSCNYAELGSLRPVSSLHSIGIAEPNIRPIRPQGRIGFRHNASLADRVRNPTIPQNGKNEPGFPGIALGRLRRGVDPCDSVQCPLSETNAGQAQLGESAAADRGGCRGGRDLIDADDCIGIGVW